MILSLRIFIFSFLVGLSFNARAFDVPALTGPVVDQAGLITPATQEQLARVLQQARQNNGPQVQILVLSSLQGIEIEEAAIHVFDKWKLGGEKEDNGVLFLIAPQEKKLRIEVGRGLEGDIPDVIAKRIISDIVVPFFKRAEFEAGIVQGVQAILYYSKAKVSEQLPQPEAPPVEEHHKSGSSWILWIVIGLWILLFLFNPTFALALLFSGGRGGRGGGGGGWSGGGGSSAGGGASGSW